MAFKSPDSLSWLGKYLSLALTLPASVAAGYVLGALADHFFHLPLLPAIGIVLGMTGGLIHVYQELTRDEKRS